MLLRVTVEASPRGINQPTTLKVNSRVSAAGSFDRPLAINWFVLNRPMVRYRKAYRVKEKTSTQKTGGRERPKR